MVKKPHLLQGPEVLRPHKNTHNNNSDTTAYQLTHHGHNEKHKEPQQAQYTNRTTSETT